MRGAIPTMAEPGGLKSAARGPLGRTALFVPAAWLATRYALPLLGGWLASDDWFSIKRNLDSAGLEGTLYFTLALLGWFCWLTYNEQRWQQLLEPVWEFFAWRHPLRAVVLVLAPLAAAAMALAAASDGGGPAMFNAIRHPTPPDAFSHMENPFRHPTVEMLDEFDVALRSGEIDVDSSTEDELVAYSGQLAAGAGGDSLHRARPRAFERHTIEQGRELFMVNCRPCHGTKGMGDGPMAAAQTRSPADFTGVETIATLVEGAVFWRVKEGGVKLPREGGPWESAMPRWELDLSDDEIWKIIMAEYDLAGNAPREPEKVEGH